jgi:hypothetical protein
MENVDCEKIVEELSKCVDENSTSPRCKEVVETFKTVCEQKAYKEAIQTELVKLYLDQ